MIHLGHHPDGSGVQSHSAGELYPYVIAVKERYDAESDRFVRTHQVIGPGAEYECPTWSEAVDFALARKAEYQARNPAVRVERQAAERQAAVGIEASIKGQHYVGIVERLVDGSVVRSYFIVGPRAGSDEFSSRQLADLHIEFLESDLHSIDLQFQRAQRAWSKWAADRNSIH